MTDDDSYDGMWIMVAVAAMAAMAAMPE